MPRSPVPQRRIVAGVFFGGLVCAGFVALFFWLAGSFLWTRGWASIAWMFTLHAGSSLYLWTKDAELLIRRGTIGEGTKAWDKVVLGFFGSALLATWLVAALDHRGGCSETPPFLWVVGAALYAACVALLTWSMRVNTHFEKFVRIQHDRAHRVIDSGPYRYVRHPGYAGTLLGFGLGTPLMLGSWYALLPAALSALVLVVRTSLEDRTLREELPGYLEYAERTRYRLVPGVW